MKKLVLTAVLVALSAPAIANDYEPAMRSFLESEIAGWMNDPIVVNAIRAQNMETADYDQAMIDALDQTWRSEVGSGSSEIVSQVLNNDAADFLRSRMEATGGVISEIFAMDAHGLNVAASGPTSDYWQGDEAKFQQTYPMGVGSVHFGEVEFDESSQTYQGQISVVIVDPESNQPIGAMTVGVNAEALL